MIKKITAVIVLFVVLSCGNNLDQPDPVEFFFGFEEGTEGWEGGYAGYRTNEEKFTEFQFEYDTVPGQKKGALKLSAQNSSNGLFMFIKRKITGLEPEKVYFLTFDIEFAAAVSVKDAGDDETNEGRFVMKAGATGSEPLKQRDENSVYNLNISKGSNEKSGDDMMIVAEFSYETGDGEYKLQTVTNESPFGVETDENGNLWLIIGTDSPFEGSTTVFYNNLKINCF